MDSSHLNKLKEAGYELLYPFNAMSLFQKHFDSEFNVALFVCNTKSFWNKFTENQCMETTNPLEEKVEKDTCNIFSSKDIHVFFSHKKYRNEYIPFQSIAHTIGLAYFEPISHMSIHPIYGPWFSMRAIVVFKNMVVNSEKLYKSTAPLLKPPGLDGKNLEEILFLLYNKKSDWNDWLSLRDSLSKMVGADNFRFSEEQILYHYTTNRDMLKVK
jgi:hypothetical protein